MPKILGIIAARGGSKRLPGKNIKMFCGQPLLVWSIEVGRASKVFDRFILSTDSEDIINVAKQYEIEVPFVRPAELASDQATSFLVVKHALAWLYEHGSYQPDWVVLLEPSSPGRQVFHIKEVAKLISDKNFNFDSLVGVSETPAHFNAAKQLSVEDNGEAKRVGDGAAINNLTHRNQDLVKTYYINSSIYAFKRENLFASSPSLWGENTFGYVMDDKYSLDIDTKLDLLVAEVKMKNILNKN